MASLRTENSTKFAIQLLSLLLVLFFSFQLPALAKEKQEGKTSVAESAFTLEDVLEPVKIEKKRAPANAASCCKVCTKGKACGDSCISRKKNCHKTSGCACDG